VETSIIEANGYLIQKYILRFKPMDFQWQWYY
jgi:hypothetical protein